MRNTQLKLPIVFTIAVLVLATGWGAADAQPFSGVAFRAHSSGVSKEPPADQVTSGEPDTPGAQGGNGGSNTGTGKTGSCRDGRHPGVHGMALPGRMWAMLFLIRYFAR